MAYNGLYDELNPAMKTMRALAITIANTCKLNGRNDWRYETSPESDFGAEMKSFDEEVLNVLKCLWNKDFDDLTDYQDSRETYPSALACIQGGGGGA